MGLYKEEKADILSPSAQAIVARKYNSTFSDFQRFYRKTIVSRYDFPFAKLDSKLVSKILSTAFLATIDFDFLQVGHVFNFKLSASKLKNDQYVSQAKVAWIENQPNKHYGFSFVVERQKNVAYTTIEFKKLFAQRGTKIVYREIQANDLVLEKYSPQGGASIVNWRRVVNKRFEIFEQKIAQILKEQLENI